MSTQLTLFDYGALADEDIVFVQHHAANIKSRSQRLADDIVEIGTSLQAVKDKLDHGQFSAWIKTEFNMSHSSANNFMNVAARFKDRLQNPNALGFFPLGVLYELAPGAVPEDAIDQAVALQQAGEPVTRAVARELADQAKEAAAAGQGDSDPAAVDAAESDVDESAGDAPASLTLDDVREAILYHQTNHARLSHLTRGWLTSRFQVPWETIKALCDQLVELGELEATDLGSLPYKRPASSTYTLPQREVDKLPGYIDRVRTLLTDPDLPDRITVEWLKTRSGLYANNIVPACLALVEQGALAQPDPHYYTLPAVEAAGESAVEADAEQHESGPGEDNGTWRPSEADIWHVRAAIRHAVVSTESDYFRPVEISVRVSTLTTSQVNTILDLLHAEGHIERAGSQLWKPVYPYADALKGGSGEASTDGSESSDDNGADGRDDELLSMLNASINWITNMIKAGSYTSEQISALREAEMAGANRKGLVDFLTFYRVPDRVDEADGDEPTQTSQDADVILGALCDDRQLSVKDLREEAGLEAARFHKAYNMLLTDRKIERRAGGLVALAAPPAPDAAPVDAPRDNLATAEDVRAWLADQVPDPRDQQLLGRFLHEQRFSTPELLRQIWGGAEVALDSYADLAAPATLAATHALIAPVKKWSSGSQWVVGHTMTARGRCVYEVLREQTQPDDLEPTSAVVRLHTQLNITLSRAGSALNDLLAWHIEPALGVQSQAQLSTTRTNIHRLHGLMRRVDEHLETMRKDLSDLIKQQGGEDDAD